MTKQEISKIRLGDTIVFNLGKGKLLQYRVCSSHLETRGKTNISYVGLSNELIFKQLRIKDKNTFCDKIYGYPNKGGGFPEWEAGDYKAMRAMITALYEKCAEINGIKQSEKLYQIY